MATMTEFGIPFPLVFVAALTFLSYQTGLSRPVLSLLLALLAGRIFGGSSIYRLSRVSGNWFINWIEKRSPSLKSKLLSLPEKLAHHTPLAVCLARLTPGLATAVSIASGICKINYPNYLEGVSAASLIADGSVIAVALLARSGTRVLGLNPAPWEMVVIMVAILAAGWGIIFIIRRLKSKGRHNRGVGR